MIGETNDNGMEITCFGERLLLMERKDFSGLEEQIMGSVQSAIDSMDFKNLNQKISDTVNVALNETRSQLIRGLHEAGRKGQDVYRRNYKRYKGTYGSSFQSREIKRPAEAAEPEGRRERRSTAVKLCKQGRFLGIVFTVFGAIGLGAVAVLAPVVYLLTLAVKPFWGGVAGAFLLLLLLGAAFAGLMGTGISMGKRLKRAGVYLKQAGDRLYCNIGELAGSIGKSRRFVVKDLQRIIGKGILPQAHMDEQKTCLMLDEETYRQYLAAQASLKERELLSREEVQKPLPDGLQEMMEQGQNYLRVLREANEAIPGEAISGKLKKLETIIRKIFETVERRPEQMEEMERFMEYYLPTTVKLVTAYRDFDRVEIEGGNIKTAKQEIEKTLDTINTAFVRLLDDLYQDAAMDVSADASVLQAMLKKDGFAESDFTRRNE